MENIALYRKYRPQDFDEIIGQEHIVQTLKNSLKSGDISHAYLFSGPRGSGKTTIARIFAKAVNCQTLSGERPCNKCNSCLEITAGKSIDLVEIDAASHTGVDDVREIIDSVKFVPVKSKYKIFIIDECHQLSKAASNALLKTLEEPPSHVIFLLATTEAHKMISTIISRCQRFDFKRLNNSEIIKKLEFIAKKENIKIESSALSLIAFNARGSFRDAESLLDKCINFIGSDKKITTSEIKELLGIVEVNQIAQFIDLTKTKNIKGAISFLNSLANDGTELSEFAKTLIFYTRHLLLAKIHPEFINFETSGFSLEEIQKIKNQSADLTEKELKRWLELFIDAENKMKYASILQLPLEIATIDIIHQES